MRVRDNGRKVKQAGRKEKLGEGICRAGTDLPPTPPVIPRRPIRTQMIQHVTGTAGTEIRSPQSQIETACALVSVFSFSQRYIFTWWALQREFCMIVFVHRSVTFYLVYLATLLELSLLIRRMPSWYDLIPAHGYL
ncbi:hypothetical protein ASPSYDRAFT_992341 [Aspergillus sydowii CBS 593.65]|uniref:Uncharacterized protein n=1 Tax=Aspergillus sydowii CBS 593.65 TaxID=1036612 RepID=A0A1L9TI21_9EURO|nr:uncharacterized protein ASPSYDRAFT_992341 [Aspergillus sydowii CBS 593.65]OJJ59021.1 hypothetical protein ASPSYDRAFT_992341 [Aspergillus sydowii CBS 593.65]